MGNLPLIGSTSPRSVRILTKIVNFPSPAATSARSKNNPGGGTLKVRKFQKEIVASSILPKNNELISEKVHSNEKDEVCHSFLVEIFTKSLHRGGVAQFPSEIFRPSPTRSRGIRPIVVEALLWRSITKG